MNSPQDECLVCGDYLRDCTCCDNCQSLYGQCVCEDVEEFTACTQCDWFGIPIDEEGQAADLCDRCENHQHEWCDECADSIWWVESLKRYQHNNSDKATNCYTAARWGVFND